MAWSAAQRYLAEFLGTFALLLFGGGAAVTTLTVLPFDPLSRVIAVSASFGLVVTGVVYALGDISGGHFNPAVTLSMWITKRMPARDVLPYVGAQVVGGVLGILVIAGVVAGSSGAYATAQKAALGSQCFSGYSSPCGFSLASVFLIELALTFTFVLVIQRATHPDNTTRSFAPLAIGFALLVTNVVAIPVDGASINPARSFAPALVSVFWPSARWAIEEVWLFWLAPIVGGLLAGAVELALRPTPRPDPSRYE